MSSKPHTDSVYTPKRKPKNPINFHLSLNEEQKAAKSKILENTITVLTGGAGSGKAQDLDSLVITPNGTKRIGDISPGDLVISENGESIKVLNIFPQGKKDIYKITFSDGLSANCCEEHLWNVIHRNHMHREFNINGKPNLKFQKYETLSLKDIIQKGINMGKRDKFFIPQQGITQFDNREVSLDPYILGCLIGDGSLTGLTPEITSEDKEIIDYFQSWCDKNNLNLYPKENKNKQGNRIQYSITSNKNKEVIEYNTLTQKLREYNLMGSNSFSKFIPKDYLYNTKENRIELLQGLMDTDGWIQINKFRTGKGHTSQPYYCTVSKQLKDDFVFLIQSLGGLCYVTENQGKYKAKGEKEYKLTAINYRICINLPNELRKNIFKLNRKQERITEQKNIINRSISKIEFLKNDEAVCILVDSPTHLYLTDNFIVTHNTLLACQIALDQLFNKEIEKIIIARPVITSGEELGFLPGDIKEKMDPFMAPIYENMHRLYSKEKIDKYVEDGLIEIIPFAFMRGRNISNAFVIIDEAQNVTDKQMELVITRLCIGSKMIIVGDVQQTDLKERKMSGLYFLNKAIAGHVPGTAAIHLKTNHRHEIVEPILAIYKELNS
jgi:phosphate starvation-inducible protein PhoH